MSTDVDETNSLGDPEAEVRKLKDLVRKLEQQNELLRTHTIDSANNFIDNSRNSNADTIIKATNDVKSGRTLNEKSNDLKDRLIDLSLNDVDIIDLSEEDNSKDDSWLYQSPKRTASRRPISPQQWLREDFEHPSPEVESSRRALIYKLEELTAFPRSPSSGTLGSLSSPGSTPTVTNRDVSPAASTPATRAVNPVLPTLRQPLIGSGSSSKINTNTFTRPKKSRPGLSNCLDNAQDVSVVDGNRSPSPGSSPQTSPCNNQWNNNLSSTGVDENANGENGVSEGSGSLDSLSMPHRLQDVTDVQTLARKQEESLRQSMNSPFTPRKSMEDILNDDDYENEQPVHLTRSLNRSVGGLLDSLTPSRQPHHQRQFTSPGRLDGDLYQLAKHSNNSLASLSSNGSISPPVTPYDSQDIRQAHPHLSESHRRSLPNLTRSSLSTLPSHPSDSRLADNNSGTPRRQSSGSRGTPSPTGSASQLTQPAGRKLKGPVKNVQSQGAASARTLSPSRVLSPPRQLSPQRGASPQRGMSPGRTLSPHRTLPPPAGRSMQSPRGGMRGGSTTQNTRNLSPQRKPPAHRNTPSPQRTMSPSRALSPGRAVSPQASGIPRSTGIPRPGSMSKLPTPNRRSSIPSMRRNLTAPKNLDESWKDGCY